MQNTFVKVISALSNSLRLRLSIFSFGRNRDPHIIIIYLMIGIDGDRIVGGWQLFQDGQAKTSNRCRNSERGKNRYLCKSGLESMLVLWKKGVYVFTNGTNGNRENIAFGQITNNMLTMIKKGEINNWESWIKKGG